MRPILFQIGELPAIYSYGFFLFLGLLCSTFVGVYLAHRDGVEPGKMYNIGILSVLTGIGGGRLEYVRTHWAEKFADHPLDAFNLREGGYVFYGGLVLAVSLSMAYIRWSRLSLGRILDAGAVGIPIGIAFARIGCLLAGCCYGGPSDLPWAIQFPEGGLPPGGVDLHPTQMYEHLAALSMIGILLAWRRVRPIYGLGLPLLAMLYGPWRIFNEALRGDGERGTVLDGLLTNGQATSLILMAIGVLGGLYLYRNGEKVDRAKA
jgi:phosphatidylglycerol:prolipoprotein diacylglycerol transferase